jgi:hypothetical protein
MSHGKWLQAGNNGTGIENLSQRVQRRGRRRQKRRRRRKKGSNRTEGEEKSSHVFGVTKGDWTVKGGRGNLGWG